MKWAFYIDGIREVHPDNVRELQVKVDLENEFIHDYRKKLEGPITLNNLESDDFDFMKAIEETGKDAKHSFDAFENGQLSTHSEFTIYDCDFDNHKSSCGIKITPRDKYTEIQENENIEGNIIGTRYNVSAGIYSYIVIELKTRADITPFTPPADETYRKLITWYQPLSDPAIPQLVNYVYWAIYASELIIIPNTDTFDSTGWQVYVTLDDYKIYRRFPVGFNPNTLTILFPESAIGPNINLVWDVGEGTLYGEDESDWTYIKLVPTYDVQSWIITNYKNDLNKELGVWIRKSYYNGRLNTIYNRNYSAYKLKDALNRLLQVACPSFTGTVKSTMLFDDPIEPGKVLGDYLWIIHDLYLIEMSDFKKPNASQIATKAITTFKKIVEFLCWKHFIQWCIDNEGNFRLEHYSYYPPQAIGTTVEDNLIYSYLSNDKPNREYLSEATSFNEDFGQIEVLYGTVPALNGVKEATKSKSLSDFYTDIDGMNTHLDQIPDDGFVYVEALNGTVVKGTGFKSGNNNLQNANLSNANCLNLYYRHNAYQQSFKIGGRDVEAITLKRMKKQDIEFEAAPDIYTLIQTGIMAGEIKSYSYYTVEENAYKAEIHGN
jgi:hypothetical protein